MSDNSLHLARSFDEVADLYDAHRPGYPADLFVDLMAQARLDPDDAILELGCGTGQATRGLAPFGRRVLAIDPGSELVGVAKHRLEAFPHVHFAVSTFEAWAPRLSAYRLIVSAQAFHWIDPLVALPKAAAVLAPGGMLACFAYVPQPPPADFLGVFEPIYRRLAPQLWVDPPERWYWPGGAFAQSLAASGLFELAEHRVYPAMRTYTADGFVDYLRTRSDYRALGPERLDALLAAVAKAVRDGGGTIEMEMPAHLHMARRRPLSAESLPGHRSP
ncbi:class I SAM-dependent methyltransferase [Phenylobacterium sp.]|uniref:class I SAM-dependent methyltransferase n=1 Tax=Phenylobacterium sp. TaxID=1871053 RepID=UPI0030F38731